MAAVAGIGIGLQVIGALGQRSAGRQARRAARQNAVLERMETAEQSRRLRIEQREREGLAEAISFGTGTAGTGSQAMVLDRMRVEHQQEMDWLRTSGAQRERVARMGGDMAARQGTAGMVSGLAGAALSAYGIFGPRG